MPEEKKPLDIALEEYTYWRDVTAEDNLRFIQIGAIGAAANIAGRLAVPDVPLEGIAYRTLTPTEICRTLTEIQLAPKLAHVLATMAPHYRRLLTETRPLMHAPSLDEAEELLTELKKAGVL